MRRATRTRRASMSADDRRISLTKFFCKIFGLISRSSAIQGMKSKSCDLDTSFILRLCARQRRPLLLNGNVFQGYPKPVDLYTAVAIASAHWQWISTSLVIKHDCSVEVGMKRDKHIGLSPLPTISDTLTTFTAASHADGFDIFLPLHPLRAYPHPPLTYSCSKSCNLTIRLLSCSFYLSRSFPLLDSPDMTR